MAEEYGVAHSVCFNKDNYDPNFVGPTWNDLLDLLVLLSVPDNKTFDILFCGRAGSDGKVGGTGWGATNKRSVQHALFEHWDVYGGKLRELSESPNLVPVFAQTLLGLEEQPIHITGIFIRV